MDEATPATPLEILAASQNRVELGPIGFAALTTDACRAYQSLAADLPALRAKEPQLLELVRTGSPAAVVYAALLLEALGREDLRALLAPYDDDRRPCAVWPGGCSSTTSWLCEATRWVLGQTWTHPERELAYRFESVASPNWLELPSAAVMARAPTQRRDGKAAYGAWTFGFAELWVFPNLARGRELAERTLAKSKSPAAAFYAAMLLWKIDRARGEQALTELAARPGDVDMPTSKGRWPFSRGTPRERVRMEDAAARCRAWLGEQG